MAQLLATPAVRSSQFTWDATTRTFSAEHSDLGNVRFGRVYADACDTGFTVIGRNDERIPLVVTDEKRDAEGDLQFWTLRPVDARHNVSFTVFND